MGRPSKFTEETIQRVTDALQKGNTRRAACIHAGISEDSLSRYMERDADFAQLVRLAEAKPEMAMVDVLFIAAQGEPYERRTRQVRVETFYKVTTFPDGTKTKGPVQVELVTETVETGINRDWRAGIEWLKRRHREQWGDHADPDLNEEIARLLADLYATAGKSSSVAKTR